MRASVHSVEIPEFDRIRQRLVWIRCVLFMASKQSNQAVEADIDGDLKRILLISDGTESDFPDAIQASTS
jgi:hypothetical protein